MLAPSKMTSTPCGNSMRASNGPLYKDSEQRSHFERRKSSTYALSREPLRATVKPLSVTLVTVPPLNASVASSTMCETTKKEAQVSPEPKGEPHATSLTGLSDDAGQVEYRLVELGRNIFLHKSEVCVEKKGRSSA